ncbi:hypothetical protein SAMN05216439_0935 [Methanobrevibacter gottschalkii]|uniref:Uncharacterized protein n=1 Tax=Methanobrevibacter gottschalkii TaxID=190974 RepID=A0A1H7GZ81_9EURY|nr:hypothetical protein SAMN05216439_0935 [Methanobrevibacter gottschalkii]
MSKILKINKIILVGIVLLTILSLNAVSAYDNSNNTEEYLSSENYEEILSADSFNDNNILASASYNKTIYVNYTGDDSGSGSQNSPYATLNKAISNVNDSDNAVVYLSAGRFSGENNTDLSINLAHRNYNSSLTIIGAGNGQTILDGNDESAIFTSISADSIVTLINITFTHGKSEIGSVMTTSGNLTIDNCIFDNNYATSSAAIYAENTEDIKITNSVFKNNYGHEGCADFYCEGSESTIIDIINSTFINSTTPYLYSLPSFLIQYSNANIIGNKFENITGVYHSGTFELKYGYGKRKVINNTFINCNYTGNNDGGIIYISNTYLKNNQFINCTSKKALIYSLTEFNAYLKFKNATINGTEFKLYCEVTDDLNNSVSTYGEVHFFINDEKIKSSRSNNGTASISVIKLLDNGDYTLSGTYYYYENPFEVNVKNATLHVDFNHDPLELWVSNDGNDTTGNGSENNPFKTLKHALNYGFENTIDLTIHMKDGVYTGSDNKDLSYSNVGKLTIFGESYRNTIIDAENTKKIFNFGEYLNVTLANLTLRNTSGNVISAYILKIYDSVIEHADSLNGGYSDTSKIIFNNLTYTNSGGIYIYNAEIYNSKFKNCNNTKNNCLLRIGSLGNNIIHIENTTIINNTVNGRHGSSIVSISGNSVLINNDYINNTVISENSKYIFQSYSNKLISVNETFIGNNVSSYIAYYDISGNNVEIIIENITFKNNYVKTDGSGLAIKTGRIKGAKFINNTALNNGGAIIILPHYTGSQVPKCILENVFFENNSANNGKDIFIEKANIGYENGQLDNITVTFNSLITHNLQDIVIANISHVSGAVIGGGMIEFDLNGSYMGVAEVINGVAKLNYLGFTKNGNYTLSGSYNYESNTTIYNSAVVNVILNPLKENITSYVSDSRGDDENGNGSYENPYKTIENALNEGYKQSKVIFIKVLEGNYTGKFNNNITIYDSLNITIIGEGIDKTIITGNNTKNNWFITVLHAGNGFLKLINMTISEINYNYKNMNSQKSAVVIEKGANVFIDSVKFTKNRGYNGGAINNQGTLNIINSIFYNNGDSSYGGSIYNKGITIIDNSSFIANHAKYCSDMFNEGILNIYNSNIQDSMRTNGWTGNTLVIGGLGNISIINSKIFRTGKMPLELIDPDDTYADNPAFTISIGTIGSITLINTTIDGHDAKYTGPNFYITNNAAISWSVSTNIKIHNSSFLNLNNILNNQMGNLIIKSSFIKNVSNLIMSTSNYNLTVINSYFADGTISTEKYDISNIYLNNNWWGSNSKPTYKVDNVDTTPETWLILTLNQSNKESLLKDIILSFKVTDGENITDYTGYLYPRPFTMSAINATLEYANGNIINHLINQINMAKNATSYYIEAKIDNQTVNLTSNITHNVTIIANDIEFDYGTKTITVNVLFDNLPADDEIITLKVNNKEYSTKINNGIAIFNIDTLVRGTYTLNYNINATELHDNVINSSTLIVNGIDPNINASSKAVLVGNNVTVTITIPSDLTGTINVILNNKTYVAEIHDNKAIAIIPNLAQGNYLANVIYSGDEKYLAKNTTLNIKVLEINISAPNVEKYYKGSEKLRVIVIDSEGNAIVGQSVQIKLNNVNYTEITNQEGIVSVNLDLNVGKYSATILVNDKKINTEITIKSTIQGFNMIRGYNSGLDYQATLLNDDGTPLDNTLVKLKIGNRIYEVRSDANGVVKLNKKLTIGTYTVLITNPSNFETQTATLKIVSRINNNKNIIGDYLSGFSYKVRIIGDNGKSVGAREIVKFKINKKTYNIKTDKKGYASLKITLTPKTYQITATYKGQSVKNKITVKQILKTAKKINIRKSAKKLTLKATLKKSNKKPLKNKKITFKFKGKTYTTKTNNKGIAKIIIKKNVIKKLKVGKKYTVKVTYVKDIITGSVKVKR